MVTTAKMLQSGEEINPSILIDSPEEDANDANEETDSFIPDNTRETNNDEQESNEVKLTSSPSMLNIAGQHLQIRRSPSSASRYSWGGASAMSGITFTASTGNNGTIFFFLAWIAFIFGLIFGGFWSTLFLCDCFDNKQNHTVNNRSH